MSRKCEVLAVAGSAMLGAAPAWSEALGEPGLSIDGSVLSIWQLTYSSDPWADQYTAVQLGARLYPFDLPSVSNGDTGWFDATLPGEDLVIALAQDYCVPYYLDFYARAGKYFPMQQFGVGHVYGEITEAHCGSS